MALSNWYLACYNENGEVQYPGRLSLGFYKVDIVKDYISLYFKGKRLLTMYDGYISLSHSEDFDGGYYYSSMEVIAKWYPGSKIRGPYMFFFIDASWNKTHEIEKYDEKWGKVIEHKSEFWIHKIITGVAGYGFTPKGEWVGLKPSIFKKYLKWLRNIEKNYPTILPVYFKFPKEMVFWNQGTVFFMENWTRKLSGKDIEKHRDIFKKEIFGDLIDVLFSGSKRAARKISKMVEEVEKNEG